MVAILGRMGNGGGESEYCGCGKCLVGVVRLSRVTDSTNSPEKQRAQVRKATAAVGGHLIGWAEDLEVSGAMDPLTRPGLGPWLRGERGLYSGIVGAAVDRIGRNVRDVLNTAWLIVDRGGLVVTYGHDGPWNFDDINDENQFQMQAWGAQMELRAIQRRNREETIRAREAGVPKHKNSYGYRYVRRVPNGRIDHVEIDPVAAKVIREVAKRILSDDTGTITVATEAVRLTRAGVLSPSDHRAVMYGREPEGRPWTPLALKGILRSEAALGYLMHDGRAVLGPDGHPRQVAEPLWDQSTHEALKIRTEPKRDGSRAPRGVRLLSGRAKCGICGAPLYLSGRPLQYRCTARVRGLPKSAHCKPSPGMLVTKLDQAVTDYFLTKFGGEDLWEQVFDPGTGHAARITQLEADRRRLREDRAAGLYDSADDAEWFRREYARMGAELDALRLLPERAAGMRWVKTGQNVRDLWDAADGDAGRRELLANYDVTVVLYPSRHSPRMWIHNLDPDTENDALWQIAEAEERKREDAEALAELDADEAYAIAEAAAREREERADIPSPGETSAGGVDDDGSDGPWQPE